MPSLSQAQMQTVYDSGLEPLKMNYETVTQFSSQKILLRSTMTINSMSVGVLEQEQYRYVARRTVQSEQLFKRQLHKVMNDLPGLLKEHPFLQAVSIPVYNRMLKKGNLGSTIFDALAAHPDVSASNLCMEVSADVLFEDLEPMAQELQRVQGMGIKISVWEVGDPYCPLLRLSEIPYNYIFLDSYAVNLLTEEKEGLFEGLCRFLHTEEKTAVFAVHLPDWALCQRAEALGCDGYSLSQDAPPPPEEEEDEV